MKKRLLTLVTAALLLSFAGAAMATEKGAEAAAGNTQQVADIVVTKHMDDQGETVLCIAERDFARLLEFYERAQERANKSDSIDAAFENIYSDW